MPGTLAVHIQKIVDALPEGAQVFLPVDHLKTLLKEEDLPSSEEFPPGEVPSWRERIWSAPEKMRLFVDEAAEALGKSRSYVYKYAREDVDEARRIPHHHFGTDLVFVVGELRSWLERGMGDHG